MEKPLELIGALLIFFVAYLYLPHIIFKWGAERFVELGRRRDTSELEEFVASALPSIIFVVLTHLANQAIVHIHSAFAPHAHWGFTIRIRPDWDAIAAFVSGNGAEIERYLTTPYRRGGESSFLLRLVVVSLLCGLLTGSAARRRLKHPKFASRAPKLPAQPTVWNRIEYGCFLTWFILTEIAALPIYTLFRRFIDESLNPLQVWQLQQPFVSVRTQPQSRLYFGQFVRYDKSATGEIDIIVLRDVQRYCYDEIDICMIEGRSPLRRLGGEVTVKWSVIGDIDTVPKSHVGDIKNQYERLRIERLAGQLRRAFAGWGLLTVPVVYRLHGGTTKFDVGDYRAAIGWLATRGLVDLDPPIPDLSETKVGDHVAVRFAPYVPDCPNGNNR